MKQVRATTANGKSKNAKDKSPNKNKPVTDELHDYNFEGIDGDNSITILGPTQTVHLYFTKHMPCSKTPEQLRDIVGELFPAMEAMKKAINAHQVHAVV